MSMEMTMNFNHMAPWGATYEDFELAQQNAMKTTRAEKILAMKSLRSACEKMVFAMIEQAGITDGAVLQVKSQMNKNDNKVDLYGRIQALSAYNVIDMQSARNYEEIRILGNYGIHDYTEPYASASIERIQRDLERMLKLLHRESLLFVNKYMRQHPTFNVPSMPKSSSNATKSVAIIFVCIVIAIYGMVCVSRWIEIQEHRAQMEETIELNRQYFESLNEKSLFETMLESDE